MTLEDFFTLSELKDGLTAPDRVKELITVMQSENDSIVRNFGEATRQRSMVATTIAATENKTCLDLFIHLNGLNFIDTWLKDAQKLGNDTGNGFLEDSIVALLRALERLPIDNERLSSSGIGKTVQNLVAHGSSVVCTRAKTLCDRWMLIQDNGLKSPDVAISTSHGNDNVDTIQRVIVKNETTTPDKITDHEPVDRVEVKETYGQLDVSQMDRCVKDENEINCRVKADSVEMSTLSSSHLEQIASSADVDVDNTLDSSVKTDVRGDEDDVDNARRVSIEVQREVDSRERSCSTSEKMSGGGSERLNTPDSTNCKESLNVDGSDKEVMSESEKTSSGGSERPSGSEPVKDVETRVSERGSCKADITASQISEIAQESEADTGRGLTGFDLNQDVCSEEVDNPINPVSSTVSVVSASRAVAASGLPAAPLQFEGTLGWKGSASTSAFRPIPDSSRAHNNSKQRLDCLDIDLNVAEDIEDEIPVIFGLPSGEESSVEAGPRRPERMQLDLNSIGDDEGADIIGLDWGRDERVAPVNQNGWQSPSRSSSSSSKHPSLRNIDLNLNDRPVLEPPVDFNLGRPGAGLGLESSVSYGNPPFYGHNVFAPGAGAGAAMFFYGTPGVPIPYMVDSRGAPVVPQIMGSSQPPSPFIMNMAVAGSSSGSSGAGPTLHNFDLNTGLMIDGGNRETIQLFHHNGGSMDEQYSRANTSFQASSSSVVGGKRREPDAARWELFPVNKHPQPQPPWR